VWGGVGGGGGGCLGGGVGGGRLRKSPKDEIALQTKGLRALEKEKSRAAKKERELLVTTTEIWPGRCERREGRKKRYRGEE